MLFRPTSQQIGEPVPAAALAFLPVFTAGAGSIERVPRDFTILNQAYFVQRRNELPAVARLNGVIPRNTIRNILHMSAVHLCPVHLLEAENNCRDPQPISRIGAKRHCTRGPDNGKGAVRKDTVYHAGDTLLFRMYMDIVLARRLPGPFIAGSNAEIKKIAKGRVDPRTDNKDFGPDELRVKRVTKMAGKLLADRIPFRFLDRVVPFIIIPDRAGMDPDKIRDAEMLCRGRHGYFLV